MKLKKRHIFTIAACAIAAVFFTLVLAIGLTSNLAEVMPDKNQVRSHENAVVLDPEDEKLEEIDISWLTGPVTVGMSTDGKIHVTERSAKELSESDQMKVTLGAGALKIQWDHQWFRRFFNVNLGWFGQRDKELEVLLPRELAGELVTMAVSNTSGEMSVAGCKAETMNLSSVSGQLSVNSCSAEELALNNVSGDVSLNEVSATEKITVSTVSGGMELSGVDAEALDLDTVSGGCKLSGSARNLHVSTISGDIFASLTAEPLDVDMDSVSGGLALELPPASNFTAEHDSVSGSFKCDFATEDLGGGRVRCGSGSGAEIRMNTTSGGMEIKRRDI